MRNNQATGRAAPPPSVPMFLPPPPTNFYAAPQPNQSKAFHPLVAGPVATVTFPSTTPTGPSPFPMSATNAAPMAQPGPTAFPPTVAAPSNAPGNVAPATLSEKRQALVIRASQSLLQETRPKKQAEVEPLGINSPIVPTQIAADPPPFYEAHSAFSFPTVGPTAVGADSVRVDDDDSGFGGLIGEIERPGAPSPSGTCGSSSTSDLIQKAEAFLETFKTKPVVQPPAVPVIASDPSATSTADAKELGKNLIDFAEACQLIESQPLFTTATINGVKHVELETAAANVKENIITAWKETFTNHEDMASILSLSDAVGLTIGRVSTTVFADTEEFTPISPCTACGYIVDTVQFLAANGAKGFEGSSLEQLKKKVDTMRLPCPKCEAKEVWGDPMYGLDQVPVMIGGTARGARAQDGHVLVDPSLYKIVPTR